MTKSHHATRGVSRRRFLGTAAQAGLVGAVALGAPFVARAQAAQKKTISVGRIPWAAGNSPVTAYMMSNDLFEARAAEHGYDLTVDWRDYPTAMPQVEAMVANDLDMGMWGNTPIIRGISAGLPLSLMAVGEGHLRFVIATREGSGIRNMEDLRGKTVGALLGGDPYNALSQMLLNELGSADPRELGINLVNTPTLAQAASVPTGMDAAIAIYPAFLAAEDTGVKAIMNSFGYTEDFYEGELGSGGGIKSPKVEQSAFYPDGYYLHRSFWVTNNAVPLEHPDLVVAFMAALQEATAALSGMDPGEVSQLVADYWKLNAEKGAKVVEDDVLFSRGWVWPTENDARAILEVSKFLVGGGVIEEPLDWDEVRGAFKLTAPLARQAYDAAGAQPAPEEFTRTDVSDLRGLPVWEMDQWGSQS